MLMQTITKNADYTAPHTKGGSLPDENISSKSNRSAVGRWTLKSGYLYI